MLHVQQSEQTKVPSTIMDPSETLAMSQLSITSLLSIAMPKALSMLCHHKNTPWVLGLHFGVASALSCSEKSLELLRTALNEAVSDYFLLEGISTALTALD